MNAVIQKLIASAAVAGLGWLSSKFGPWAATAAVAAGSYIANHYFHKQLPPGIVPSNVGDP